MQSSVPGLHPPGTSALPVYVQTRMLVPQVAGPPLVGVTLDEQLPPTEAKGGAVTCHAPDAPRATGGLVHERGVQTFDVVAVQNIEPLQAPPE